MSKKIKYILFGIIGVIGVLIMAKSAGWMGKHKGLEVDTVQVLRRTLKQVISASGQLYPIEELRISPDVAGEVTAVFVKEGDPVTEGQLLAKIRPDNFINALQRQEAAYKQSRAQLNRIEASLESAKATFSTSEQDYLRKQKLFKDKVISEAEFQAAEARYKVDQQNVESTKQQIIASRHLLNSAAASVREAKENLRLTTLLSPIQGRITQQLIKPGERVVGTRQMAGTTMFHIGNLSEIELRVNVIENDVVQLHLKDSALVKVESFPDHNIKGIVTAMATSANKKATPEAVTEYEVKIHLIRHTYEHLIQETGKAIPLLPGMTASVEIVTETRENVLSVPLSAVTVERKDTSEKEEEETISYPDRTSTQIYKKPQEIVFIYSEDQAHIRKVKTGITAMEFIEILEGLKAGETIISGPFLVVSKKLRNQQKVSPRKKNKQRPYRRNRAR